MARSRQMGSCIFIGMLLAIALLPESLWAGPVREHVGDGNGDAISDALTAKKADSPVRSKRNTRLPEFWSWYKFFMDTGNQDKVQDLDRVYVAYLQNKHRVDESRSFGHYVSHLRAIYRACAESDDPDCIAERTSKPTAQLVMPNVAPVVACNPYNDPYCLVNKVSPNVVRPDPPPPPGPPAPPAPVKSSPPVFTPMLPITAKAPSGYYYMPVSQPFLSAQQQEEMLRICNPSDVECLQYHLRAAYGLMPAAVFAPSYAQLGCDPSNDPYCKPKQEQEALSGLYHLYPTCDPDYDPLCVPSLSAPAAQSAGSFRNVPKQNCNPLFDSNCNPLTATKLASLTKPILEYSGKDKPSTSVACDPVYDPYCTHGVPAYLSSLVQPQEQSRHRLGIRGKTKEGYDCYMFYDEECYPLGTHTSSQPEAPLGYAAKPSQPDCHPYDPTCMKISPPSASSSGKVKVGKNDMMEPHPDCDPEYDYNCRLRRYQRQSGAAPEEQKDEPGQQEDPHTGYGDQSHATPSFEDFLKGYTHRNSRNHSP